jgi:cysteine desulfurase
MSAIYLDYQATTPLDADVLAAMMPYLTEKFGNPHSSTHRAGREAKAGVDIAREQVAVSLGVQPSEIIFTSGATESNNLALRGVMEASPKRNRLITLATEHSCILETARDLQARGHKLSILPVQSNGLLDLGVLEASLGDDVALVSVMTVNNEIGVIQPLADIARLTHAAGALVHTDAAQAVGKIPMEGIIPRIDLLSLSAHKIYGPKGVGALMVRKGVRLRSQITGGGQEGEGGIRSGTLSPALCVGLGAAISGAIRNISSQIHQTRHLFSSGMSLLKNSGISHRLNGDLEARYHGNLSITFPGIDGARLLSDARGVMFSSGSACASQPGKLSHVLTALGNSDADVKSSIRLGFGRTTTAEDVGKAMRHIMECVQAQTQKFKASA